MRSRWTVTLRPVQLSAQTRSRSQWSAQIKIIKKDSSYLSRELFLSYSFPLSLPPLHKLVWFRASSWGGSSSFFLCQIPRPETQRGHPLIHWTSSESRHHLQLTAVCSRIC